MRFGGVISVALSLESPRVGVTDFPALWCPDFPPADDVCPPAILRPPPTGSHAAARLPGPAAPNRLAHTGPSGLARSAEASGNEARRIAARRGT